MIENRYVAHQGDDEQSQPCPLVRGQVRQHPSDEGVAHT